MFQQIKKIQLTLLPLILLHDFLLYTYLTFQCMFYKHYFFPCTFSGELGDDSEVVLRPKAPTKPARTFASIHLDSREQEAYVQENQTSIKESESSLDAINIQDDVNAADQRMLKDEHVYAEIDKKKRKKKSKKENVENIYEEIKEISIIGEPVMPDVLKKDTKDDLEIAIEPLEKDLKPKKHLEKDLKSKKNSSSDNPELNESDKIIEDVQEMTKKEPKVKKN